MGRGAYDSTDPTQAKSSAAQYAINAHRTAQAESEVQPRTSPGRMKGVDKM
jgi:hypothetical protein